MLTSAPSSRNNLHARVSSPLIADHHLGNNLTKDMEFLAAKGADGELNLFYIGPKGDSHDSIYNLKWCEQNPRGWQYTDLNNPFVPVRVAAGSDPKEDGRQVVFAQGESQDSINIYYCIKKSGSNDWDSWKCIDTSQADIPKSSKIRAMIAETTADGLELFFILDNGSNQPYRLLTLWRLEWQAPHPQWEYLGRVDSTFMKYCNAAKFPEELLGTHIWNEASQLMDLLFVRTGSEENGTAKKFSFSQIEIEEKESGYGVFFFYSNGSMNGHCRMHFSL